MGQCELCASEIAAESGRCAACADVAPGEERDELLGQVIFGRYRLVRILAEGGMGRVYVAEQSVGTITRPVAVKVLRQQLNADKQLLSRFAREAETLVRLTHPNTVQLFDFGALPDGTLALVMEYVEGHSLARELTAGPLPLARAERLLAQLCGALREAHAHGIVHRDLKPDNLLIARRLGHGDLLKVLDFGIAKVSASEEVANTKLTQQGMIIGTPPYMSPEQFSGEPVDARSDIYSLGMIVFEMLTGRLPFDAKTPWEWASKHLTQPPDALPLEAAQGITARHADAIARALEKRADARPQTVDEFLVLFGTGSSPSTAPGVRTPTGLERAPSAVPPARSASSAERAAPTPTPTGPGPTLQELRIPGERRWRAALGALVAVGVLVGAGMLALRSRAPGSTEPPALPPTAAAAVVPGLVPPLPPGVTPPAPSQPPTRTPVAGAPSGGARARVRGRASTTPPADATTRSLESDPRPRADADGDAPPAGAAEREARAREPEIAASEPRPRQVEAAPSEPRPSARPAARPAPAPVPEDLVQRISKIRESAGSRPEVAVGLYQAAAARYGKAPALLEVRASLTSAGERRERELVGQGRCAQAQALHRALSSAGAAPPADVFNDKCRAP